MNSAAVKVDDRNGRLARLVYVILTYPPFPLRPSGLSPDCLEVTKPSDCVRLILNLTSRLFLSFTRRRSGSRSKEAARPAAARASLYHVLHVLRHCASRKQLGLNVRTHTRKASLLCYAHTCIRMCIRVDGRRTDRRPAATGSQREADHGRAETAVLSLAKLGEPMPVAASQPLVAGKASGSSQ